MLTVLLLVPMFEVSTAVKIQVEIFWVVMLCTNASENLATSIFRVN
jgi:hypothetical protein